MSREHDKHLDELLAKVEAFGYNGNNLWCAKTRLVELREREAALLALCPLQPEAVAILARDLSDKESAGAEGWRCKVGEPVRVVSVGYQKGRFVVSAVYVHDRYQEHGTNYWRPTRESSRYCYSFHADWLVLTPGPVTPLWTGCACIDGDGKDGRPYGWFQQEDVPCPIHPLTPRKP